MKNAKYRLCYLISLVLVFAAAAYPLKMGIFVLNKMAKNGGVPTEEYPKYVIPYTPIAVAVIIGVLLIPLLQKLTLKFDMLCGSLIALVVFLVTERYMETHVLVQTVEKVPLQSWQLSLCMVPPNRFETRTWEAVDVLLGGYSPTFKIHFYLISLVIIISLLNSFYGFAKMIRSGDYSRRKSLIIQATTGVIFLGMCIWACFTSFYRGGELNVSPLSAVLMAVFFALLGITVGVFAASFTLGKRRMLSTVVPTLIAGLITILMYIGEMCLLNGNLYRFGHGILFDGLGAMILAPIDILIILASGATTHIICRLLNQRS